MSFLDEPAEVLTGERTVEQFERPPELPALQSAAMPSAGAPEFQMLVELAKGRQRDENALASTAKRIGQRLGARAIYSFPAGGSRIEGPTVHLIEALAQAYGCLLYGTRIDQVEGDRVTVMGMCIDAITGVVAIRPALFTLAPAPAKFANKADQVSRWETMQVQNAISKATRGVLQHALPRWYIDIAFEAADQVRQQGLGLKQGQTLQDVVTEAVNHFAKQGISQAQLEGYLGAKRAVWTISDVLTLREAAGQLKAGTLSPAAFALPTGDGEPAAASTPAVAAIQAAAAKPAATGTAKAKPVAAAPAEADEEGV